MVIKYLIPFKCISKIKRSLVVHFSGTCFLSCGLQIKPFGACLFSDNYTINNSSDIPVGFVALINQFTDFAGICINKQG